MIKNYLKVAWRNLMKNKIFSFINVFGLSIGLTCCILIALYIHHETSYDTYHGNIKQLYQVGTIFIKNGKDDLCQPFMRNAGEAGRAIRKNISAVDFMCGTDQFSHQKMPGQVTI